MDGSYHVSLDLDREQKKQIKVLAASRGISVRELLTGLVTAELATTELKKNKREEQQN